MEGSVYLKARQEWDERYADLVLGKRNWQITAAGMMAITLVLAFGMVWVSTRSEFVPYVVEVARGGPEAQDCPPRTRARRWTTRSARKSRGVSGESQTPRREPWLKPTCARAASRFP